MANTPHLVRIKDIGSHVREVIENLNAELWEMNQKGHFIEMPEELTFEMIVLKEFEAFTSTDKEISDGKDTQGGYQTDTDSGKTTDAETGTDVRTTHTENSHVNNGTNTTENSQA